MEKVSPALSALRDATRALHEQLEASLPVASRDAGREEFVCYLQDMWGWLATFEKRLWRANWPEALVAPARADKLAWIEQDLRASGMAPAEIAALPVAGYRPALATAAQRFGVAYVIEGAQLGTRVLGRALAPALEPWSPRWLQGYGDEQAGFWRSFIACAEAELDTPEARRDAAAAAADAFASLAAWFAQRQRLRVGCN
ncbi:MAG TPA: biliverdin-producing heme oxygenase [Noviherbaspirillum sp.]|jgi:heme oxygenase|uniref:biliverdin-producing heme oxygenase n=1 Tax=Noviherbaspirillum sp. TaxID=1926288 RepID=UPI002F924054